jgi:hypothetical protein
MVNQKINKHNLNHNTCMGFLDRDDAVFRVVRCHSQSIPQVGQVKPLPKASSIESLDDEKPIQAN